MANTISNRTTYVEINYNDGQRIVDAPINSLYYLKDGSNILNFYSKGGGSLIFVEISNTTVDGQQLTEDNIDTLLGAFMFKLSSGGSGGTDDYNDLSNKPTINNIILEGNKTLADLGIQAAGDYATKDYVNGKIPTLTSQLTNDSGFINTVDSSLSTDSVNPVQNKVVATAINTLNETIGNINNVLTEING